MADRYKYNIGEWVDYNSGSKISCDVESDIDKHIDTGLLDPNGDVIYREKLSIGFALKR